jgi:prepilin-type N-terminal cleavage/methylation domain-containing protein
MDWCARPTYFTASWRIAARCFLSTAGFSLTEVMTAIVIFALGLVGFGSMQVAAVKLNAGAHHKTQMSTVAQEQMEELLSLPFTTTLADPRLQDNNPTVGQGTTYCVWYPPEGIRPCKDPTFQTAYPSTGGRSYCQVTTQSTCSDTSFAPPTLGYKVQWTVDIDNFGHSGPDTAQLAYIELTISKKLEGRRDPRTYSLSFARSNR